MKKVDSRQFQVCPCHRIVIVADTERTLRVWPYGWPRANKEKKENPLGGTFCHIYAYGELNRLTFTMDIMGKFINRTATSFMMLFLLNCCFPNFAPRNKESECVDVDSGKFALITQIGVIDQEYPYSVYYIMNNDSVLVCKGYRIKMIRMEGDTLMIDMDGEILYHRYKIKKYRVKLLSLK